jgi:hypothetical protein
LHDEKRLTKSLNKEGKTSMQKIPQAYELYRHFSGKLYQVLALAKEAQTGKMLVVYQALYGDYQKYVGDYTWFTGMTFPGEGGNKDSVQRFQLTDTIQTQNAATIPKISPTIPKTDPLIPQTERSAVESLTATSPTSDAAAANPDEIQLDPLLIEFLDSNTYEAKLNILSALRHRITDSMINTMAVSCDVEVDEGDVEERYASLRNCLLTLEKYECNRLRNR